MVIRADARHLPLQDGCVDCVVTSPPYFAQRDYGHAAQIGIESDPSNYIDSIVEVFDEVWRVLKTTGSLFLNLGDSYASGGRGGGGSFMASRREAAWQGRSSLNGWRKAPQGCKDKDLLGIPWAVAFALRDRGWYLRADNIWSKPNPGPSSAKDRTTISHEYVFLLSRSQDYYFDWEAIAEPYAESTLKRGRSIRQVAKDGTVKTRGGGVPFDEAAVARGRHPRSVWTIAASGFRGGHFATMPEDLVEPCIRAGCPEGGLVLDPFSGAGTVGVVAAKLQRRYVGVELNADYIDIARKRIAGIAPLFNQVSA